MYIQGPLDDFVVYVQGPLDDFVVYVQGLLNDFVVYVQGPLEDGTLTQMRCKYLNSQFIYLIFVVST